MRPRERRDSGQGDLLRSRLDQIIDLNHPLVALAGKVDWAFLETTFGERLHRRPRRAALADPADGRADHPQIHP